jgi:hypothetical protein
LAFFKQSEDVHGGSQLQLKTAETEAQDEVAGAGVDSPPWYEKQPKLGMCYSAFFKRSLALSTGHVVRIRVVEDSGEVYYYYDECGESTCVGFAGHNIAWASTSTAIGRHELVVRNEQNHIHLNHLRPHIPKTAPYTLALRVHPDGKMPQIQFNEDGMWHNFVPEDRTALAVGPWFSHLNLLDTQQLDGFRRF